MKLLIDNIFIFVNKFNTQNRINFNWSNYWLKNYYQKIYITVE